MTAYYNEIEKFACDVIRANIQRGRLPDGYIDQRDIREVNPADLVGMGYKQLHLFAGIGVAAYACRLAGIPDDFSIGTFGFPCQDISAAGKGEGLEGKRSGLFYEAVRIFAVARPTWLLAENVAALRTRGADRVIEELEAIGYTVLDPVVVGADDIGATHRRKRVWIVARLADARCDESERRRGLADLACETREVEANGGQWQRVRNDGRTKIDQLPRQVFHLMGLSKPNGPADLDNLNTDGSNPEPSTSKPKLNHKWVAQLMGLPSDWCDLPSEPLGSTDGNP